MKKKLLSLLMASVLVLGMSTTVFAAEVYTPASAVEVTESNGGTTIGEVSTSDSMVSMFIDNAGGYTEVIAAVDVSGLYTDSLNELSATLTFNLENVKAGDDIKAIYFVVARDYFDPVSVEDGKVVIELNSSRSAMGAPLILLRKASAPSTPSTPETNTIVSTTDSTVSVTDSTNVLPAGTTMNTEKVASGATYETAVAAVANKVENKEKVAVYEINLEAAGVELHQLAGKVKVTVDVPFEIAEGKTIKVYRVEGTELIPCDTVVSGDKVVFETDHFSTYVFVEEDAPVAGGYYDMEAYWAAANAMFNGTTVTSPKTGDTNIALIVAMFAVATAGVVVVRRKVAR